MYVCARVCECARVELVCTYGTDLASPGTTSETVNEVHPLFGEGCCMAGVRCLAGVWCVDSAACAGRQSGRACSFRRKYEPPQSSLPAPSLVVTAAAVCCLRVFSLPGLKRRSFLKVSGFGCEQLEGYVVVIACEVLGVAPPHHSPPIDSSTFLTGVVRMMMSEKSGKSLGMSEPELDWASTSQLVRSQSTS